MTKSLLPFTKKRVFVLRETATVAEAARVMAERHVGCVIVSDGLGHVSGLITDRDLTCKILAYKENSGTLIQDIMTKSLLAIEEHDDLKDAIKIMRKSGVRRVPILKIGKLGKQRCVGLVTFDELVGKRLISTEDAAKILRKQINVHHFKNLRLEQRRQGRQQQTLNTFYKILSREMGVSRPSAVAVGGFLLTQVIERISHNEALHFISELPKLLQDELRELPSGPDRKITPRHILQRLDEDFGFDTKAAFRMVRGFWSGLEKFLAGRESQHLLGQFSKEMQVFFAGESFKKHRLPPSAITSTPTVH